ncbi:MAG: DNA polymerase ligase N-terminal domain-containing protein [Actinomycetota bacterium]|nr:DNA polymerase ligase N-terminal domain-containing protein [Actinomycetota bacterium]
MKLEEYWRKRKFEKTPEPRGEVRERGLNQFVVQEHHATRLHYDFRLEMDGVLKSWAVPKGVPEEKGVKHLAVAVEDHPVDYIDFEGTIPEGHYGAGTVEIWDSGEYELFKRTPKEIEFVLKGKRLRGRYILFFTGWKGKDNWLIFRVG